ncbi:MAG TPA: histidine kinase [Blastococcus sp.]|nr:histidine kinase [Blastococcus sp.]
MRRSRDAVVDAAVVALALADSLLRAIDEESGFVVSLVAALALVARRRWPYVAFALTLPALYTADVLLAPLVAVYGVAVASRSRGPVLLCAVIVAVGTFIPWPPYPEDVIDELRHLPEIIFSAVYAAAPVALGFLVQARRELSSHLAELTAGREREQHLVADRVLAQERSRLAREMHDVVSHKVSLIAVQAGALRVTATDPVARESAEAIRALSVQTLEELRQMVAVLRTDGRHMADLSPQPGLADLPRLIRDSGLDATLTVDGVAERRWPEPVERAVYRTVQEALTNVGKHAPGAAVAVQVVPGRNGLSVAVRNGPPTLAERPVPLPGGGHGLLGLRERAELLGGVVRAAPTDDGGFLLEVLFPDVIRPAPVS